jgi:predicted RNA-binding Zn-ribbon protein involved in translation (DUF1610 family)
MINELNQLKTRGVLEEVTEELYEYSLGCVPPISTGRGFWGVGEISDHASGGVPIHAWFKACGVNGEDDWKHYAVYGTQAEAEKAFAPLCPRCGNTTFSNSPYIFTQLEFDADTKTFEEHDDSTDPTNGYTCDQCGATLDREASETAGRIILVKKEENA